MQPPTPETFSERLRRSVDGRFARTFAWCVWLITLTVICGSVAMNPTERTVTMNYRVAAESFWHQQPMYAEGQHGWLYPPQGAVLYSLFSSIPSLAAGEVLWRIAITLCFVWSLMRLARLAAGRLSLDGSLTGQIFLITSLASLALATGCMRNGQMNLPLAGLFILSCCDLAQKRWWMATLWLCLALVAKPIALPMVMLAGLLFPKLWTRLPIGLLAVAVLPFVNPHWNYVMEQYLAAFHKMRAAGEPGAGVFSDLTGMLQMFPLLGPGKSTALQVSPLALTIIRGGAALATLGLSFLALKRFSRALGCFYLLLFCAGYLMLFNPRTEGNSYIIFIPVAAVLFAWAFLIEKHILAALALFAALVLFAAAHEFYHDKLDSVWIRPLCTLVICMVAAMQVLRNRPAAASLFVAD